MSIAALKAKRRQWNRDHPESIRRAQKALRERKREGNQIVFRHHVKCRICGLVFEREEGRLRMFKFIKSHPYECVCDECQVRVFQETEDS